MPRQEDDEVLLPRDGGGKESSGAAKEEKEQDDGATPPRKLVLWRGSRRRLVLLDPMLFAKKTALVFVASYLLIPLLAEKGAMPAWVYASLLVVIHVGVLGVYLYRVRFRSLDFDRYSLGARILGLALTTLLLFAVSGWQDHSDLAKLSWQMLVLCAVHTILLVFLMVAVERTDQDR